jgi:hypothetical protein
MRLNYANLKDSASRKKTRISLIFTKKDKLISERFNKSCGLWAGGFAAFSLILTFSRWEKEQPLVDFVKYKSSQAESGSSFAKVLGAFLPLPAGEGRGEG